MLHWVTNAFYQMRFGTSPLDNNAVEDIENQIQNLEHLLQSHLVNSTPAISETETAFNQIDRRHIKVDRISDLIFTMIVAAGFVIGLPIAAFFSGFSTVWFIVAAAGLALTIFLFWLAIVLPIWDFERTRWRLSANGLEIHRGVFWRHQISIPIARVQHADVSQGPLQRMFELGRLTLHTAGTENASVELNGIAHTLAIELRDKIVSQRKSIDVV